MSNVVTPVRGPLARVLHPDGDTMIDPKWFVGAGALAVLALIYNFSIELGFAASTLLFVVAALYLWISFRLAPERDEPRSEREALFLRFSKLSQNRRLARVKELGAKGGPDAS